MFDRSLRRRRNNQGTRSGKISQQKLAAQKSRSQLLLYYKIKLDFDQGYGALVTGSYLSCLTRSTALHYNA